MKIQFRCGCGMVNHTFEDWVSHWKYGTKGKWHAIVLFLKTKIEVIR